MAVNRELLGGKVYGGENWDSAGEIVPRLQTVRLKRGKRRILP